MNQFNFYANKPFQNYRKVDMPFVLSVLLLGGLGIFTFFVVNGGSEKNQMKSQIVALIIGFSLFLIFTFLHMKIIRKTIAVIVIASFILCLLTFIKPISAEINGARRWLKIPGNFKLDFKFQPSETAKFAVVLFLANFFDKRERSENPFEEKNLFWSVIALYLFAGVVVLQKDMSTSVFILAIGNLMFFASGQKLRALILFDVIAAMLGLIFLFSEGYRIDRILGWLNPQKFGATLNFQPSKAKIAISSGGFWGKGIGPGLEKIRSVPANDTDYIFSGWAESMGYIGAAAYFAVLIFFAWRGYKISLNCPDRFSAYAGFGCVSVIFLQSVFNAMIVCGILPSTGIPLPFFSKGGSSLIVTWAMCGFIANVSRGKESANPLDENDEISLEDLSYLVYSKGREK